MWTPELYKLRKLQRENMTPIADKDVKLFLGMRSVVKSIHENIELWNNTKFAVASRTKSVDWAHNLLDQFNLTSFFDYLEIFPGDKKTHFRNLKEKSGIPFEDMIFFDDNRDGKFGNCVPVSELGVLSVHCPNGIYNTDIFDGAIKCFQEWRFDGAPKSVVECDGSLTKLKPRNTRMEEGVKMLKTEKRTVGSVKMLMTERKFGFIRYGEGDTKDMFFHFNELSGSKVLNVGDIVSFVIVRDNGKKKQKYQATKVTIVSPSSQSTEINADTVEMRVFSMNQPFAALLANGYKTLESRNGTMFKNYPEGTKMLLHVGQRTYPDGNRHVDLMKNAGLANDKIQDLKSLPSGFNKGMAVAIVELGETYDTELEQRCDPTFQRKVCAYGEDSGMRATEIKRVSYLKKGLKFSGKHGIFKVNVEKDVIPDGWLE